MKKADKLREVQESEGVVTEKCKKLAGFLRNSKCTLVYTGAGISTAASIPDYRGPNGVWTLAEKGIALSKCGDPVQCCPTTSHMVLKELCRRGIVRHILSQNCDGLHLRSGVPQKMLSEIHGNMHIEVCTHCDPPRQFVRPFDVTQKSQFRRHGTGRTCTVCNTELVDTIVHFGETGRVPWPLNWKGVTSLIEECDLILCVGTSLAVLKQYQFLWPKPKAQTQIAIVNLQWTPKDRLSSLKINARCDVVFEKLAKLLSVPVSYYCRDCDPVLNPRRNARICELRERLTDCSCHLRVPRSTCTEQGPRGTPGWWSVGIQKTIKRSLQSSTNRVKRPVGRPRKRKNVCAAKSRRVSLDEQQLVANKTSRLEGQLSSATSSSDVLGELSSELSDDDDNESDVILDTNDVIGDMDDVIDTNDVIPDANDVIPDGDDVIDTNDVIPVIDDVIGDMDDVTADNETVVMRQKDADMLLISDTDLMADNTDNAASNDGDVGDDDEEEGGGMQEAGGDLHMVKAIAGEDHGQSDEDEDQSEASGEVGIKLGLGLGLGLELNVKSRAEVESRQELDPEVQEIMSALLMSLSSSVDLRSKPP